MLPNVKEVIIEKRIFLIKISEQEAPVPMVLMIHGLTGDEKAMFVFANRIPSHAAIVSPRGFYNSPAGGFSWCHDCNAFGIHLQDLRPALDELRRLVMSMNGRLGRFSSLHLLGFSQGASLSLSWLYLFPGEVDSLVCLAGRIPEEVKFHAGDPNLVGKPVFWGHGTRDQLVPIDFARDGVAQLQDAGADVLYCEDAVGHKLSASCYRSMEAFNKKYVR